MARKRFKTLGDLMWYVVEQIDRIEDKIGDVREMASDKLGPGSSIDMANNPELNDSMDAADRRAYKNVVKAWDKLDIALVKAEDLARDVGYAADEWMESESEKERRGR